MSFGGGSSGGTTTQQVTPYAPTEPALAQIVSEAGNLYNQGAQATGYVALAQLSVIDISVCIAEASSLFICMLLTIAVLSVGTV